MGSNAGTCAQGTRGWIVAHHATRQIRSDSRRWGILPDPELPDKERWKAARGPHYYPLARTLGGVSLFDFHDFNPEEYSEKYPLSSWSYFVSYLLEWNCAVWIEINREQVASNFISASEVVSRWNAEKARRHTIMPHIEAAYIGILPRTAFRRAFVVRKDDSELRPLAI